ncbi:hypothetical protein [Demequina soli]|uniref:hypothetical protein n=1 Tax=Demequina soli TaxID=1638987 RepID=UPI000AA0446B|nr:hypothetical protein [Demequina soli]
MSSDVTLAPCFTVHGGLWAISMYVLYWVIRYGVRDGIRDARSAGADVARRAAPGGPLQHDEWRARSTSHRESRCAHDGTRRLVTIAVAAVIALGFVLSYAIGDRSGA